MIDDEEKKLSRRGDNINVAEKNKYKASDDHREKVFLCV